MTEYELGFVAGLQAAARDTERMAQLYAIDSEDPAAPRIADILRGRAASIRVLDFPTDGQSTR